jgi:spore maturation protein CgeB
MKIVIAGLSISSSWGNGHATTYRGLVKELNKKGVEVIFFERDVPWYSSNRDMPSSDYCKIILYKDIHDLKTHAPVIAEADLVIVGSYVPEGVDVGKFILNTAGGVTAFYDIDTPVTLAKLKRNDFEYLHPQLIKEFNIYLSFTGGPLLNFLQDHYGSPMARPLYCSFDPDIYFPESTPKKWHLGYLGTYSPDRQPPLQELMMNAALKDLNKKYVIAGPQYPSSIIFPANIERIEHLPPSEHRLFYNSQHFTLNITREDMIKAGYSPSVRLFEAAACAVPIISDYWDGLNSFFEFDKEILISGSSDETITFINELTEDDQRRIGEAGRNKVLNLHTASKRAEELLSYYQEALTCKV